MLALATQIAALHHVEAGDVLFWLGVLIVLACLVGAGFAAWRALWLVVVLLLIVAIVAAFLLL
jgi:hypothetical protein